MLLPIAVTAAVLLVLPPLWFGDSPYTTGLATEAVVFGCYAVGFNLIFGSTNQLFLCVGALAGVGGYATAILSDKASLPLVAGVAIGTVTAAIVGGLGSVAGAFLAGVLLGVVDNVSAHYIGEYVTAIVLLAAAALTILVRPRGLLGR